MAGGPPFFLTGAAHVEDVAKVEGQRLVGRGQVGAAAVIVEQGPADDVEMKKTQSRRRRRHNHMSHSSQLIGCD